eukprot:m.111389 g.111389  ORF g.111389 m.111389 type:complete len:580 (+) comp10750_c0_seq1:299-2038(+)
MSKEEEEYFILRLPEDIAVDVHRALGQKKLKERLKINMCNTEKSRQCRVTFDKHELIGKVTDLPTITEVLRTKDTKVFCKLGDLSQMVVCYPKPKDPEDPVPDIPQQWNHGITPPLKNVRKKRFRKTARKKVKEVVMDEGQRVRREVELLLARDMESKKQSGIDAVWKETFEGGGVREGDVAQLSDLDEFAQQADISKAGFADSDSDEDDKTSMKSFATSVTALSAADGTSGRRPSVVPSVSSLATTVTAAQPLASQPTAQPTLSSLSQPPSTAGTFQPPAAPTPSAAAATAAGSASTTPSSGVPAAATRTLSPLSASTTASTPTAPAAAVPSETAPMSIDAPTPDIFSSGPIADETPTIPVSQSFTPFGSANPVSTPTATGEGPAVGSGGAPTTPAAVPQGAVPQAVSAPDGAGDTPATATSAGAAASTSDVNSMADTTAPTLAPPLSTTAAPPAAAMAVAAGDSATPMPSTGTATESVASPETAVTDTPVAPAAPVDTTTTTTAPMDVDAPPADAAAPAPVPPAQMSEKDEKLAELDKKIAEQQAKVDGMKNPNLKKRFAAVLDKLKQEREELVASS